MIRIPFPRALPLTIAALGLLLAVRLLGLLFGAAPDMPGVVAGQRLAAGVTMVGVANAATPEAKPAEHASGETPKEAAGGKPDETAPDKKGAGDKLAEKPPQKAPEPVPPRPAAVPTGAPSAPPAVDESERGVLLDLHQRRQELDTREGELASREAMAAAAERRLGTRIDELSALQAKLEGLDRARHEREEANWRGLVKIYEDMKPREAAAIFNGLELKVLLEVLDRMREAKSAPILAAMQPDKARQATADLADKRLRSNTIGG